MVMNRNRIEIVGFRVWSLALCMLPPLAFPYEAPIENSEKAIKVAKQVATKLGIGISGRQQAVPSADLRSTWAVQLGALYVVMRQRDGKVLSVSNQYEMGSAKSVKLSPTKLKSEALRFAKVLGLPKDTILGSRVYTGTHAESLGDPYVPFTVVWESKPFGYRVASMRNSISVVLDRNAGVIRKYDFAIQEALFFKKPVIVFSPKQAVENAELAYAAACKLHQKKPEGLGKSGLMPNKTRTVWILPNRNLELLHPEYSAKTGRVCRLAHVFTFGNSIRADRVYIDVETGKAIGGQILSKFNTG